MLLFDAAADYIEIASGSKWNFTPGNERAWSFRLRTGSSLPDSDTEYQSYHLIWDTDIALLQVVAYNNSGVLLFGVMYRTGSGGFPTASGHALCVAPFAINTNYHVVVNLPAAIENTAIYVDGELQTITTSLAYQVSTSIVTDANRISDGIGLTGSFQISHLSVHNAVLDSDERTALASDPYACLKFDNLLAYFPVNETSGVTIYDRTASPANGTLNGTPTWQTNPYPYPSYSAAKYEPPSGRVLHGLGQFVDVFYTYAENWTLVSDYETAVGEDPLIYSTYASIDPDVDWVDVAYFTEDVSIDYVLNIGLMLWDGDFGDDMIVTPAYILDGDWDARIIEIARQVKNIPGPVYVRPGFEFGSGNSGAHSLGMTAAQFIDIWQYIVDIFRAQGANNIAWIWNTVNPDTFTYMDWYPGDDYVDWWGINYFTAAQIGAADGFVETAATHFKPVMICESNPSANSTTVEATWAAWFTSYFAKIAEYPHIKAFIYISDPWDRTGFWESWADSRINTSTTHSTVRTNYASELSGSEYVHLDEYLANKEIIIPVGAKYLTTPITGQGSVTRSPNYAEFLNDEVVTLTAYPADNWDFTEWGGDLSGSTNPDTVTMSVDRNVTVLFTEEGGGRVINIGMKPNTFISNKYRFIY